MPTCIRSCDVLPVYKERRNKGKRVFCYSKYLKTYKYMKDQSRATYSYLVETNESSSISTNSKNKGYK